MSDTGTIEPGPEPDPTAEPHGDFSLDDLITEIEDPGLDIAPVELFTADEIETLTL